jgi:hypothetical protein
MIGSLPNIINGIFHYNPFNMRPKLLVIIGFVASALTLQASCEDKIAFVYELVRHGARAPVSDNANPGIFDVPEGMLTHSGMR